MNPTLNDSLFDEAFKIISTNKAKANSLRQSLLKNNNYENDQNLNVIQYLGEFEYDLKTLFEILRDLKLSYHEIHNTLTYSNINNKNIKNFEKEESKKLEGKKNKKEPCLYNNFNDYKNTMNGIGFNKTYYMTNSQFSNFNKNCNKAHNYKEYYINSCPRPSQLKKFPRSMSCKSYVGDWNSSSDDEFNDYTKDKKDNDYRDYPDTNRFSYYSPSNKNLNNRLFGSSIKDRDFSKDKSLNLNFDYDAYLTDYSLNKTNKKDINSNNNNSPGQNLNLSDLNNDNNNLNNYYYNPSNYDNNINNADPNLNYEMPNKNNINKNDNKNNYFTFAEQKSNQNKDNNYIISDPQKQNINNSNGYNIYNNSKDPEYNRNLINNKNLDNRYNNKYNPDNFINNKYNNRDNNNIDNQNYNYNISPKNKLSKNISEDENNNKNYINNKSNDDKNNNKNKEDEDLENQKKEIIKNIISEIFQDTNKLNLLKKELGDDIGEKLLSNNISEEELFKVVEILKNQQDKNMNKKNQKYFPIKKYNQPRDKILLKESLIDKRYNYREFPKGWSSTKDYFINNGSTYIRNKKGKNL